MLKIKLLSFGFKNTFSLIAVALLTVGCATSDTTATPEEVVAEDLQQIYFNETLTEVALKDAIALGLAYNLDAYIARQDHLVSLSDVQLQKLNSLPTITAKFDFITRSNSGASSSISALTGVQSLEPSISTDQSRWTNALEVNWNVLDSAINIYRSKSSVDRAIIVEERARKVRQNVIMDVYSAFWRAAIAQKTKPSIEAALKASDAKLNALKVARKNGDLPLDRISAIQEEILGKRKQLNSIRESFVLSELELKALISFPPERELKLIVSDNWFSKKKLPNLEGTTQENIDQALKSRPEIREELLNLKISQRDLNASIYESFPGLNFLVTGNSDQNSFLQDSEWLGFTASLSQSVTRLLTLPARYERAEKEIDLAHARRQALVAAVISQAHIAEKLVEQTYKSYDEQLMSYNVSREKYNRSRNLRKNGLKSGFDEAIDRLDFEIAKIELYESFSLAQNSFARLMNTIGYDVENISGLAQLKKASEVIGNG